MVPYRMPFLFFIRFERKWEKKKKQKKTKERNGNNTKTELYVS